MKDFLIKNKTLLILLLVFFACTISSKVLGAELYSNVFDTSSPTYSCDNYADGVGTNDNYTQYSSFVATGSGIPQSIQLARTSNQGGVAGTFDIQLRVGSPTGEIIASSTAVGMGSTSCGSGLRSLITFGSVSGSMIAGNSYVVTFSNITGNNFYTMGASDSTSPYKAYVVVNGYFGDVGGATIQFIPSVSPTYPSPVQGGTYPSVRNFNFRYDSFGVPLSVSTFSVYSVFETTSTPDGSALIYRDRMDVLNYATSTDDQGFISSGDLSLKIPNQQITEWRGFLYLTDGSNPYVTFATTSISFTVDTQYEMVEPITTSTIERYFSIDCSGYSGGIFSSSTLGALGCYAEKTLVSVAGWFVIPPDWSINYIKNSFSDLKTRFPFSLVYGFTDTIKSGVSTATSSAQTSLSFDLTGSDLPYKFSSSILTPTTLNDTIGATSTTAIFTAERAVIWIATMFVILSFIL